MVNNTSILQVLGGEQDPIGTMRKFIEQNRTGEYEEFDLNTLATVFLNFITELDETNLTGKNRKRELGALLVKHFEGEIKEQEHKLPFDVQMRIQIDAVIYYKINYEKGKSEAIKEKVIDLINKRYSVYAYSIKAFERWYDKWSTHVDNLFKDPQTKKRCIRQMQENLEDKVIITKRLTKE